MLSSLQQDILVLVCTDNKRAPFIRGVVDINSFDGPLRVIAERAYNHFDRFKRPPGQHLRNILSDKLEGDNTREAELYSGYVDQIYLAQNTIDPVYVMSQIETLIKREALRTLAKEFSTLVLRDTEAALDEAEQLLAKSNRSVLSVFDPGLRLSDKSRALAFLDVSSGALPTGIPELDRRDLGPVRKELWLLIANTKRGKSWGLIHLGKMALVQRLKVCHITLEMSDVKVAQRYFQTFCAMSKRKEFFQMTHLKINDLGQISGYDPKMREPKLSMDDPKIREKLEAKIDKWAYRALDNIRIKEYPTGTLTIPMLEAYLDNLQTMEQFVPDLLIVDYPDLFKLPIDQLRLATGQVYKALRGLLVSRNMAGAIVSQSHRAAAKAKLVGSHNVSEDYSKIAHADTILTLSQTDAEQKFGLARLQVDHARNDEDKITVVISQQYAMGHFVVDSHLMVGDYFGTLPKEDEL